MAYNAAAVCVPGNIPLPNPYPAPGFSWSVAWWGAKGDGIADDYPAIQAAINYIQALGNGSLYFPTPVAHYSVSQSVTVTGGKGINLIGDGSDKTIIAAAGGFPAFATNGFWRSNITGLQFATNDNSTGGAFQLDGGVDGGFGVQGNHFDNCIFFGNYNSLYCFTNVLIGGARGQGSENLFSDCGFFGTADEADSACFLNNGDNAEQNTIIGGDFQSFVTGVLIAAGNVNCYSVGFQSTYGLSQLTNAGADIQGGGGTTGDYTLSDMCRTESLIHVDAVDGNAIIVRGMTQQNAVASTWGADSVTALGDTVGGTTAAGNFKLYECTTAGTTGGSAPTWPETGTVSDNTVVWTFVEFDTIGSSHIEFGGFYVETSQIQFGGCHTWFGGICINTLFTRYDVYEISNGGVPQFNNCFTGGVPPPSNEGTPVKITTDSSTWLVPNSLGNGDTPQLDLLSGNLLFRGAAPGGANAPYFDVAVGRGQGDDNYAPNNSVKIYGGLLLTAYTYSDLTASHVAPTAGTIYFCSDGTGGTPGMALTGSGNGCACIYQHGGWISMS